jgi:hypothetical protein
VRRFTILHTIETGGPGGAETVLLNLASRLNNNRFRIVALLSLLRDGFRGTSLARARVAAVEKELTASRTAGRTCALYVDCRTHWHALSQSEHS